MTMPPALLICPECKTVCRWNNHRHIMAMLERGSSFVLIYCPNCRWCVEVPDDYLERPDVEDFPF